MAAEQDFNVSNPSYTLFMCILYLTLGTIAIFANTVNIIVFWTNRELRMNYLFHVALDAGEIVNGISYILTGLGRGTQFLLGNFATPMTVHQCFYTRYWPIPLILGTEIPAWMTILTSAERIIAVHKPGSYKKIFSTQMKIFFIAIIFCCILLSLGGAAFSAYGSTRQTSTQHCAIISSTSKFYSTFHFTFVPFAYVSSFISLCIIARLHKKASRGIQTTGKKGPQLNIFIVMTAFDIVLCAAPSIVMIGASWGWFTPNDLVVSLTYSTTGFLSLCHTGMNAIFHSEYRKQIRRIFARLAGMSIAEKTLFAPSQFIRSSVSPATINVSKITPIVN
uniref:Uncharacterized protein n=1 Tax=Panagrolaimus sp. ES5 TaxID=591445 RepID=A0AC34FBD5_9BILA